MADSNQNNREKENTVDGEVDMENTLIRLNVRGDRRLLVRVKTLTSRSAFFADRLSRANFLTSTAIRGSSTTPELFIDAMPEAFEQLLFYLSSGRMPLLWTARSGFDAATYTSMAALAAMFELPAKAQQWLRNASWERTVSQDVVRIAMPSHTSADANSEAEELGTFHGGEVFGAEHLTNTRLRFVCPRGLPAHNAAESCGADQMCVNRMDGDGWVERLEFTTVLLVRSVKINWQVLCLED